MSARDVLHSILWRIDRWQVGRRAPKRKRPANPRIDRAPNTHGRLTGRPSIYHIMPVGTIGTEPIGTMPTGTMGAEDVADTLAAPSGRLPHDALAFKLHALAAECTRSHPAVAHILTTAADHVEGLVPGDGSTLMPTRRVA